MRANNFCAHCIIYTMITLLSKIFIKNPKNYADPLTRRAYGILCSVLGIVLNVLLFVVKFVVGLATGAISIMADSYNNLSDAGSSLLSLLGFKFATKKASDSRPFGNGRIEYVTGLVVAIVIVIVGITTFRDSVENLIYSKKPDINAFSDFTAIIIIGATILVKIYMIIYNRYYGKKINSQTMKAVGTDSLTDVISTSVVLICALVYKFTGVNLDGWCGALVSVFITYSGIMSVKDTIGDLLGKRPDVELVNKIYGMVLQHREIVGVHDLVVHDYGPGKFMISLHAEVSGEDDIYHLHDVIDNAMKELDEAFGAVSIIHLDPICTNDENVTKARVAVGELVKKLDERITVHDFRMVEGPTHVNYIFDAVVPHDIKLEDKVIKEKLEKLISDNLENTYAVIKIEKSFI